MVHNTLAANILFTLVASLLLTPAASAVTPGSDTLKQWDSYQLRVQADVQNAAQRSDHFLWIDQSPDRKAAVQSGNVLIAPLRNKGYVVVQSGLIHHWIGAVFLPKTTAAEFIHAVQDYSNYANTYKPAVTRSKLLTQDGDQFTYTLTVVSKTLSFKTGLRGEFQSRFVSESSAAGYSISQSTKLRELDDPDGPHEHDLSPNQDHGYVQRILTVVRYREEKDGLFAEVESVTLSRDIPAPVRWIANPIVERVSREVMTATLDTLKEKLQPWSASIVPMPEKRTGLQRSFR